MFQGKVCVMTGAVSGIGRLIAQQFAAHGCAIAFMDADRKSGAYLRNTLYRKFGTDVFFFQGNVGKEEDLEIFASVVVERYGSIDYFINYATFNKDELRSPYDTMEIMQAALRTSVAAPCILDKIFKNHFEEDSVVVYTVPERALFHKEDEKAYRMVRESVEALTRICAEAYKGHVRVNCICPDEIRHGDGVYLADTICFLCDDKAGFINGKSMGAEGGLMKMTAYPEKGGWKIVCE